MNRSKSRTPQDRAIAEVIRDRPANIRRPQVAKHQPRIYGEPFDPARVSRTLSPQRG